MFAEATYCFLDYNTCAWAKTYIHSFSDNSSPFKAERTKPSAGVSSQKTSDNHKYASFNRTVVYLMHLPWVMLLMDIYADYMAINYYVYLNTW